MHTSRFKLGSDKRLSQHLSKPSKGDWILIKQVLRYIKGTVNYSITYAKSENGLKLIGYSDADLATNEEDRHSITGYYFTLNQDGPAISWKSKKQPTVALSSCEVEYMALSATTQESVYLNDLLIEINKTLFEPATIKGDNQGAIAMFKNLIKNNRSKHIDIKFHFIRDYFIRHKIILYRICPIRR